MRYNTCPAHPGVIIENRDCPLCGHPANPPKDRPPFQPNARFTMPSRRRARKQMELAI